MKIAIVYDLLYPFSIGGAESRNFSLAKELVLRGHEVHLFGLKMWTGNPSIKISKNFYAHGVSRGSRNNSFRSNRKLLEPIKYSFSLFFELMKQDFDLIDVSAFPYFPVFSCRLYSILKKKPMITTWHEVWDDYWKEFGITGFFRKITEKITAAISKNNVCVSELTADRLKKISSKKDIKILTNWVNIEEIEKAKPMKENYDIISIGKHLKHKNFAFLLKICAILRGDFPKLRVLMIGEGPETLNLLAIRKKLDLEKEVDILSFTKDHELIYSYMKSSKIFVLLSALEGFSIVSFEAMACGLPVITINSDRNALADYIENGKNGFVCDKNEIEILDKLHKLLKNKKLLDNMCVFSKKFAEEYDIKKQVIEIEKYYTGLIKQ